MVDYNITFPNGNTDTIQQGTINNTYDIPLVGQDAINYGDDFATAYIRLLSSFANTSAPSFGTQRVTGQLWYDTTPSTGGLNIYDGTSWDKLPLDANVVHTSGAESIAGVKTFSSAPEFTAAGAPFVVNSTTTVANLSAETLDGNPVSYFADSIQGAKADAAEPGLGNPGVNGYVLSSTTGGTRSWVAAGGGGGGTVDLVDVGGAGTPATMFVILADNATGVGEVTYTQAAGLTYNASSSTLSCTNFTGAFSGTLTGLASSATLAVTATGATNINISSTTSSDGTTYPVLVGSAATGNQLPFIDNADFSYNANTGTLTATAFVGAGSGITSLNMAAASAGTLATNRGGTGSSAASTGTGGVVLNTSPTFVTQITTPLINNASGVGIRYNGSTKIITQDETGTDNTSGATVLDGAGTARNIGFNDMITTDVSAAGTTTLGQTTAGHSFRATNTTGVVAFEVPATDTSIPNGAVWIMRNFTTSTGTVTIDSTGAGDILRHYNGSGTLVESVAGANPYTLARGGVATVVKVADGVYEMWGIGITGGA